MNPDPSVSIGDARIGERTLAAGALAWVCEDWDWERTLPTDDFRESEKPLRSRDGDLFFLAFLPVMLDTLMMLAESERSRSDSVPCMAIVDGAGG